MILYLPFTIAFTIYFTIYNEKKDNAFIKCDYKQIMLNYKHFIKAIVSKKGIAYTLIDFNTQL